MEIPITELLVRLRAEASRASAGSTVLGAGKGRNRVEALSWRLWKRAFGSPGTYRLVSWLTTRLGGLSRPGVGPLRAWTSVRTTPRPARGPSTSWRARSGCTVPEGARETILGRLRDARRDEKASGPPAREPAPSSDFAVMRKKAGPTRSGTRACAG